jgi:phosphoglycolate phosphatase-like HAD superfamily hydrolase
MTPNASAVQAVIFDLDGTLVDTNDAHVEAWLAAFRDFGYHVPRSRILPEIGKGGDKLVPSILGEDSDEQDGEALRNAHGRHFVTMAKDSIFRIFPGTEDLLSELRRRSIATAVATSSTKAHLNATLDSSGLDLDRLVDHIVTGGPSSTRQATLDLIGQPSRTAVISAPIMIGDTPRCKRLRAGVPRWSVVRRARCLTIEAGLALAPGSADLLRALSRGAISLQSL